MTADRTPRTRLDPKKLLLSKWTAVAARGKELHFLVSKVIEPELPDTAVECVELEAVYSRRVHVVPWRELKDRSQWRQGWLPLAAAPLAPPCKPHE